MIGGVGSYGRRDGGERRGEDELVVRIPEVLVRIRAPEWGRGV